MATQSRLVEMAQDFIPQTGLAPEGMGRLAITGGVTAALAWLKGGKSGLIGGVLGLARNLATGLTLFTAWYYRDPLRDPIGNDPDYLYAPADGKIVAVEETHEDKFIEGRATCITIETGLFDVQLQRAPLAAHLYYTFVETTLDSSTNFIGLRQGDQRVTLTQTTRPGLFKLPSFLTDRYPASIRPEIGSELRIAQKIGINGFAQPTTVRLYLPTADHIEVLCKVGQPAQAGMTVVGRYVR